VETIAPEDGVEVLGRLLRISRFPQVSVMPVDWDRLDQRATTLPVLALLMAGGQGDGSASRERRADPATRDAILRASGEARTHLLQSFVREQLAKVLGLSPSSIDVGRPLNVLGVDSLMAIELKNRVERELAVVLPIATLLQAPDVLQLAGHLAEQLSDQLSNASGQATRTDLPQEIVPDPASRHLPFPLNDIQGAYWVGRNRSLELGGVGSHFYLEFERTTLDVERLSRAWQQLIERHEMLRAVVREDGQQQILKDVPSYAIGVTDLQNMSESEAQAQVDAIRERMAHQVYDPARWPLFEVRVTQLWDKRLRVHVSIDLLIADVWSLFILFREWGALYEQPERQLPPIALSFRDYLLADVALQTTHQYAYAAHRAIPAARADAGIDRNAAIRPA
jgi:acyl carrier protein